MPDQSWEIRSDRDLHRLMEGKLDLSRPLPAPPSPYPFGKQPELVDGDILKDVTRIFSLFPGLSEKMKTVRRSPTPDLSGRILNGMFRPDLKPEDRIPLNNPHFTDIQGHFDERTRDIYANPWEPYLPSRLSTILHEMGHASGTPADDDGPNANRTSYRVERALHDYLKRIFAHNGR